MDELLDIDSEAEKLGDYPMSPTKVKLKEYKLEVGEVDQGSDE